MQIKYAIISNDQNPEYKLLFPRIQARWNDLGIRTVYVDCYPEPSNKDMLCIWSDQVMDENGNITITCRIPRVPKVLWRHFGTTIARFFAASIIEEDCIVIISDGDLMPINKRYIFSPAYHVDPVDLIESKGYDFVATNMYPNGDHLATYIYGKPESFKRLLQGPQIIDQVFGHAVEIAYKTAKMYMMEEFYINYMMRELGMKVFNPGNRKWIEMGQDMNNLYDFQIDYLQDPVDLSPFIEFHNMRASTMTEERWDKLFSLLYHFDKMNIPPNNYYYPTIDRPWRDTMITKDGQLILGDEYDQ